MSSDPSQTREMSGPASPQDDLCATFEDRLQLLLDSRESIGTLLEDPHVRQCNHCRQTIVAMQLVTAYGGTASGPTDEAGLAKISALGRWDASTNGSSDSRRGRNWIGWSTVLTLCFILVGMQGAFRGPGRETLSSKPLGSVPIAMGSASAIGSASAVDPVPHSQQERVFVPGTPVSLLSPKPGVLATGAARRAQSGDELLDSLFAGQLPIVNAMLSSNSFGDPEGNHFPLPGGGGFGVTATEFPSSATLAKQLAPQFDHWREELASNCALRCGVRCVSLMPGIVVFKMPVHLTSELLLDAGALPSKGEKSIPVDQSFRWHSMHSLNALA